MLAPRETVSRDKFYMGMAFMASTRSKDPSTQIGAFIVSPNNEPLGSGYNGPPRVIPDKAINWERPHKYPFIKHAERNAIDHSRGTLKGATIYVTAKPCSACMLDIVDCGITRVVYFPHRATAGSMLASSQEVSDAEQIADFANVELVCFQEDMNWMKECIANWDNMGIFNI